MLLLHVDISDQAELVRFRGGRAEEVGKGIEGIARIVCCMMRCFFIFSVDRHGVGVGVEILAVPVALLTLTCSQVGSVSSGR